MSEDISNIDQDVPIQASVVDLTGIMDPAVLDHALQETCAQSNITMSTGCIMRSNKVDDLFV